MSGTLIRAYVRMPDGRLTEVDTVVHADDADWPTVDDAVTEAISHLIGKGGVPAGWEVVPEKISP